MMNSRLDEFSDDEFAGTADNPNLPLKRVCMYVCF